MELGDVDFMKGNDKVKAIRIPELTVGLEGEKDLLEEEEEDLEEESESLERSPKLS